MLYFSICFFVEKLIERTEGLGKIQSFLNGVAREYRLNFYLFFYIKRMEVIDMNCSKDLADKYYAQCVEIRHRLHQYPELSGQELETARYVSKILDEIGIEHKTRIGGNGIVGIIKGADPGKTVLLRADMDAIACDEETDLPYRSQNKGVSHSCGHDGHIAGLLLAAMILNELKSEWCGNVKLMFQPAEETGTGARRMIDEGVLRNPVVDAAFACHLWGNIPEGKVAVKIGPIMASTDEFQITINVYGSHAAMPYLTVDPFAVMTQIVAQVQSIVSRRIDPLEPTVVSIGIVEGGTSYNRIPNKVVIKGTIRTLSNKTRQTIKDEIGDICKRLSCQEDTKYGKNYCLCTVNFIDDLDDGPTPPLVNDIAAANIAQQAIVKTVGAKNMIDIPTSMGGEDFAYIAERVSSAYFFVGIAKDKDRPVVHHNSKFQFDDEIIKTSSVCLAQIALEFLHI
ncbi:amidohydrolase [Spirochaetia bacterium]|nr:amidohydrolase [Spirochaetia bacterium]